MKSLTGKLLTTLMLGAAVSLTVTPTTANAAAVVCNDGGGRWVALERAPIRSNYYESATQIDYLNAGDRVVVDRNCKNSKGNIWFHILADAGWKAGWVYSGHLG